MLAARVAGRVESRKNFTPPLLCVLSIMAYFIQATVSIAMGIKTSGYWKGSKRVRSTCGPLSIFPLLHRTQLRVNYPQTRTLSSILLVPQFFIKTSLMESNHSLESIFRKWKPFSSIFLIPIITSLIKPTHKNLGQHI